MTTPQYESIDFAVDDAGIARITFNRPQALNAWTRPMGLEVADAVRRCAGDDVRVVVITGAGKAFSSGADLKGQRPETPEGDLDLGSALQQIYNPLILALRRLPKPVIAAVNGPAVGYACSFASACDFILAKESAYFLLAFVNIGLVADGGASILIPARVGQGRAQQFAMLGRRLPAPEAHAWGLVDELVADDDFDERVGALASKLADGPRGSYAAMKNLFNRQLLPDLEGQLGAEAAAQFKRGLTAEYREGVAAFVAKRPADFRNAEEQA